MNVKLAWLLPNELSSIRCRSYWGAMALCCILLTACNSPKNSAVDNSTTDSSEVVSNEPFESSQVELSEPEVTVNEDGTCSFSVKYKFLKGKPTASYILSLRFPGSNNACLKDMAGWQFTGPEGVIKDGMTLQEPGVSKYEFVLSEAEVPMEGFTEISNVLTGEIE